MTFTPFPHQEEALTATLGWLRDREGENALLVLPTGAGKTVIFSFLCQRIIAANPLASIMILAHKSELITQAETKLGNVWPGAPSGVYAASERRRELRQITIASRDTIVNVIDDVGRFDYVIIDEAHNIPVGEKSRYRQIISSMRSANPNLVVIGFTATPYRGGQGVIYGKNDDHLFKEVTYSIPISRLIDEGYLCDVTTEPVDVDAVIDTSGVSTNGGDFNTRELGERAAKLHLVESAVMDWHEKAFSKGRKLSCFYAVTIAHAELIVNVLRSMHVHAPLLTGDTPKTERDKIIEDADQGRICAIVNVGVLTEGWDCPRLDCLVILRDTKSVTLYIQIIGRGLRIFDGKDNCLVLDYGGCIDRFGPIDRVEPPRPKGEAQDKVCPECDTVNEIFERECTGCGHMFVTEVDPDATKDCPNCNAELPKRTLICEACNHVFASHDDRAASLAILSRDEHEFESPYTRMNVSHVAAETVLSQKGDQYLKLHYVSDTGHAITRNLMIGHPGGIRFKAAKTWDEITIDGTHPVRTPDAAVKTIYGHPCLRTVEYILYDEESRWKDVKVVKYSDSEKEIKT